MLIFKRLKDKPIIIVSLLVLVSSLNLAVNSRANSIFTEDIISDTKNKEATETNTKKIFNLSFEDNSYIEIVANEDNLLINKFDSSDNNIFTKEFQNKENYKVATILPIKEYGFIAINENNIISTNSQDIYSENSTLIKDENLFNIAAFDINGDMINDIFTKDITKNYLFKFVIDSFNLSNESIKLYIENLSSEEIYNLSLYLVSIAENTLNELDITSAKFIVDMISDPIKRDELLLKLNLISSESIEKELENPCSNNSEIKSDTLFTTGSYIDLSVDTNSITFDYLNVSEDTTLYRAIALEVSSSLPYDINVILEGDIVSNTNNSILNNNVFSVKESSSDDFLTFDDTGIVTILENQTQGDFISHYIDVRLNTSTNIINDVYKAVFKIEAITK